MTPISISDYSMLREGDEVLIKAIVKYGPDGAHENEVYLSFGYHSMSAKPHEIMGIVSRNFKIGDEVSADGIDGTVVYTSCDDVVIKAPDGLRVFRAHRLSRVVKELEPQTHRLEAAE